MLDKIIPKKIIYIFDLIRLDRPIGFLLLMWPCWFALTNIEQYDLGQTIWYIYFFIGSFLMRSAGCIINDLVDINLDKKIERTTNRSLTSNKISRFEAILILLLLLFLSFLILLNFDVKTILLGFLSIPLIILYPFMKRYTYWPQLGLGLIFSWGILLVSMQFMGKITFNFFLLYIACIFWTLAYDTIYAYQDRVDDIKTGIKSTAVLFGSKGHKYVKFFYNIFFIIIGYLGFNSSNSFLSLFVIIFLIIGMNIFLNKWKPDSIESCSYYFKFNNLIGLGCFLFLIFF